MGLFMLFRGLITVIVMVWLHTMPETTKKVLDHEVSIPLK